MKKIKINIQVGSSRVQTTNKLGYNRVNWLYLIGHTVFVRVLARYMYVHSSHTYMCIGVHTLRTKHGQLLKFIPNEEEEEDRISLRFRYLIICINSYPHYYYYYYYQSVQILILCRLVHSSTNMVKFLVSTVLLLLLLPPLASCAEKQVPKFITK